MLAYEAAGDGPAVVLIHGFPLQRRMWQPQLEGLSAAGYRVIAPDLPGFGASAPLPGGATMRGYAEALIDLMDSLSVGRAVIGGMSMGGYVLLELLENHPQRASAALFLLTKASADDAAGKARRTELARAAEEGRLSVVADNFAGLLFAPGTPEEKPQLVNQVRDWMQGASPVGVRDGLLAMRDRNDFSGALARFTLPALVIGAALDLAIPADHSRALVAGLPNARLEMVPGAGHMANLEESDQFNRLLLEFLRDLPPF